MKAKIARSLTMKLDSNKKFRKKLYGLIKKECNLGKFSFHLYRYSTLDGISENAFNGLLEDLKFNGYMVIKDESGYSIEW